MKCTINMEKHIQDIINRFLEGTISSDDSEILRNWVVEQNNKSFFRDYIENYYQNHSFEIKRAFEQFESNILENDDGGSKRRKAPFPYLKYAAIFAGIALTTFGIYKYGGNEAKIDDSKIVLEMEDGTYRTLNESDVQNIVTSTGTVLGKQNGDRLSYNKTGNPTVDLVYNTLRVPYGKRFQIQLSDNSFVHLNAGSSLRYPVQFIKGKPREVFLEGEGYFRISKNKENPFIVRTNKIQTEVFGTEFNISSYTDDKNTKVVLVEGSIGVFDNGNRFDPKHGVKLEPNQMASTSLQNTIEVSLVNTRNHISWIDGTLTFQKEDFGTIVKKLERHYNVSITNNYKYLEHKKFTGKFDIESIEQILNAFQKTNNFHYTINNNTIIINP